MMQRKGQEIPNAGAQISRASRALATTVPWIRRSPSRLRAGRATQNCVMKVHASMGTQLVVCPGSFGTG